MGLNPVFPLILLRGTFLGTGNVAVKKNQNLHYQEQYLVALGHYSVIQLPPQWQL